MISPSAAAATLGYPYTLYQTIPGAAAGPTTTLSLTSMPQIIPSLTSAGLAASPQVSAASLVDPNLTSLANMNNIQNLNSINNLLLVSYYLHL